MSRWVALDFMKRSWDIKSKLRPQPCQELTFNTTFWQQYKNYLSRLNNNDTTSDRLIYGKKYYDVLTTGNVGNLLALSNQKRIHVIRSLAPLSKYVGCYDRWTESGHRYQLKRPNGDALDVVNRLFKDTQLLSFVVELS